MKKFIFICAVAFCAALISCQKKSAETQQRRSKQEIEKNTLTIGFSIDTLALERWQRDSDVFINRVNDLGAQVIVQNAGNSIDEQNKQIQYLVQRGVKTIVILPKAADSLTESIRLAKSKNIKVISYDRLLLNCDVDIYTTVNSQIVGELMAKELLKYAPRGKWFCFYGDGYDHNMFLIRNGVENILKDTSVNVDFIFYVDNWNYDLSYKKMSELLKAGRIPNAIIGGNDAVANSIIQAIAEYAPGCKIAISGQDADIAGCQNVIKGKQTVTIYKPITELARRTAELAVDLAKGKTVEECLGTTETIDNGYGHIPVLWLDPTAVTKDNMEEVVIGSGFHTKDEIYRN